jgi:maltose alpha-D-glucosyltransferase / alpha-amylase
MNPNTDADSILENDSLWYKDAVIYQLHVKTFFDSDGDGVGDFKGLTQKLDYIQNLGVTAIWILPFYPSPLKDDGYDISDFTAIHPAYGTLRDFKAFLREAHQRGLRVITELVVNHTSDQHPWFRRARQAESGNHWRDFYVWSDTAEKYKEARIIFQDFETSNWSWDPVAQAYYWHRFYAHQPDLNYDNPQVHKAIFRALDFWLDLGVDGLRLDAVPYLYEREGTNCENLPETHAFLKKLRSHMDRKYTHRMFLGEANQWPEDAVQYFGDGDECHMSFHFPLMPRLFMALQMEDRFPIIDILDQTPAIPDSAQWAVFLRNHDELTLEMVTDEERDYMYRVYAQDIRMRINLGIRRRLAPLLGNHRRRIELMNGLLLSMPGTPVIYYGDEIGMGDNVFLGDRNGVRTPMQWSVDRNAGFSKTNPQQLFLPVIIDPEYHYEVINVEAQENNRHSLLWWMKRLITIRKRVKAFSRGTLEFLHPDNPKILAFYRCYRDEHVLVVANLSRFVQYAELDLSRFQGAVPIEFFGRTAFPAIGDKPYFLTLGPHSFFWFLLQPEHANGPEGALARMESDLADLNVLDRWEEIFHGKTKTHLASLLRSFLRSQRWFGGKAREIKTVQIEEVLPLQNDTAVAFIVFCQIVYMDGNTETYAVPLTYVSSSQAERLCRESPRMILARLHIQNKHEQGLVVDALNDQRFCETLWQLIERRYRRKGSAGTLMTAHTQAFAKFRQQANQDLKPSISGAEQSNTSIIYGDRFILKFFRRLQPGVNPDLEIGRFLTEKGFAHMPPVLAAIEYRSAKAEPMSLAMLQCFVPNEGDAWKYTLEFLNHYFEDVLAQRFDKDAASPPSGILLELAVQTPPAVVSALMGYYLEVIRMLARRTGELHLALSSAPDNPKFAPEPFSKLYQRSLYQSMRTLTGRTLLLLRRRLDQLPQEIQAHAREILDLEKKIQQRFSALLNLKITAMRIRCHGDYHLGQVLFTGKDFVIIDFEGEPDRPISERQIKRSPLRDVAGMLRSFHYAAHSSLMETAARGLADTEGLAYLESWAVAWYGWVGAVFLKEYLAVAGQGAFLPQTKAELQALLDTFLLEKAIYELGYELNNRPDWVKIPVQGIRQLMHVTADSPHPIDSRW